MNYNERQCIRCGACVSEAEDGGIRLIDGRLIFDFLRAEDWEVIASICPVGAMETGVCKMRLAIIGTGMIVTELLPILRRVESVSVEAIYGRSREKAARLASEHSIAAVYDDYDVLLQNPAIEFVYIGLINSLHYEYARRALEAGKNVIVEKPFATSSADVEEIISIARAKKLYVFEAITTLHFPNYAAIKETLPKLGRIRAVQANYSQYSSRYDKYLAGEISASFDPKSGGGALADLNIYNLNFIVGLFGEPKSVEYAANFGYNGVDTSGVVLMKYDDFTATSWAAKDSESPSFVIIQGEKGWLRTDGKPNALSAFEYCLNGSSVERFELNRREHRMEQEFEEFAATYAARDFDKMSAGLDISLAVQRTFERAKKSL